MTQIDEVGFYRHNFMFQDFDSIVLLDHPWAAHVCQDELQSRKHHLAADRSARFRANSCEGFFANVNVRGDVGAHIRLRCEYQTLRRLQRNSDFILFTVKTYVDPIRALESEPSAALALSAAMRQKTKGTFLYQSMGRELAQKAMLGYLDGIVEQGGLMPWNRHVPEPWERDAEDDGTFAHAADKARHRHSPPPRFIRVRWLFAMVLMVVFFALYEA
jgi:hypothetical protein